MKSYGEGLHIGKKTACEKSNVRNLADGSQ